MAPLGNPPSTSDSSPNTTLPTTVNVGQATAQVTFPERGMAGTVPSPIGAIPRRSTRPLAEERIARSVKRQQTPTLVVDRRAVRPRHPRPLCRSDRHSRRYLGEIGEVQIAVTGRGTELDHGGVEGAPRGKDLDSRHGSFYADGDLHDPAFLWWHSPRFRGRAPRHRRSAARARRGVPRRGRRSRRVTPTPLPGTASHARRNDATSGRVADPTRGPVEPPRGACRLGGLFRVDTGPLKPAATTSVSSTRPKWMIRQRDPSVAGRSSSESATRMNAVVALGSSSVLSRAFAAPSLITPASSNTNTFRTDSTGARVALAMVVRACPTVSMVLPSGSTMFTSGYFPKPPGGTRSTHRRGPLRWDRPTARAKARATVPLPTPSGPTKR